MVTIFAKSPIKRVLPGDARDRCPKCSGSKVARAEVNAGAFHGYGPIIAVCAKCTALWEPINHDLIWDPDDPLCSFSAPCDNCAFRPGSAEQRKPEEWKAIKAGIETNGGFYCHKGVPIEAGAEHGFAYPYRDQEVMVNGVVETRNAPDRQKLRLCRGWLTAWSAKSNKGL